MESANTPAVTQTPSRDADRFTQSTHRVFDGVARHRRGIGAAALGVLVLMIIAAVFMGQRERASSEARDALFLAQKKFDAEMKALAPPAPDASVKNSEKKDAKAPPAPPPVDDTDFKSFDVNAKMPETVKAYRDLIDRYPSTRAAYDARMALGHLYLNHGQGALAEDLLNQAVSAAPRGAERALSLLAQGYARESQGKMKEALESFTQALATGEDAVKADALMSIARAYEGLHDLANARTTYDKVISQLPNTEAARNAELYKSQAQ